MVDGVPVLLFCCARSELGHERQAAGEAGGVYSVVVDARLTDVDFRRARLFPRTDLYASRLVRDTAGGWVLLAFVNEVDGRFIGELSDPVPVTADPREGLVPRGAHPIAVSADTREEAGVPS